MSVVTFFHPLGAARHTIIATPDDHRKRPFGNWQSDCAYDLGVPQRTRCSAPFYPRVARAGRLGTKGKTAGFRVGLDNDQGLATFLYHLVSCRVSVGVRDA